MSLALLASEARAQCGCVGYEQVPLVMQRKKGKGSLEQPLLAHRAGQVLFVVRGSEPDSASLFVGGRLQKQWRLRTTEDGAAYAANGIEVALNGTQDITLVNHTKKQCACFSITDKFRIVNVFVSPHTWWVTKTNLTVVIE
ncbi:hypothetical protein J4E00_17875 [Siccationidurans soli]|uniref:Uncharacterized protein n=1 Tax=Hymenobacter negativus TaxID=2795026 RepID=A0ABS3QI73_9BACT|nr:hypothetical protein [Hymenobacter negativus]